MIQRMLALILFCLIAAPAVAVDAAALPGGPVAWVEMSSINIEHGLSLLDGLDGRNEPAEVGGCFCRENIIEDGSASYLYFDYDSAAGRLRRPVYITVEYFDDGFGSFQIQYDSVGDKAGDSGAYKTGAGELLLDSRKWRKVIFELPDARFDGRQNMGADFRLACSGRLFVRKVTVEMEHSDDFARVPQSVSERIKTSKGRLVPPKKVQITFSCADATYVTEAERVFRDVRLLAPRMKALGVTSVETYVKWNFVEPSPDHWDWSFYDGIVAILRENGLKWNPFIIIGPAYATPAWYRDSKESVFATCLEHGTDSKIQSIWNPDLSSQVDLFMSKFAEHYGPTHTIESIMVGISGDFGEAIYPAFGGGWTEVVPGKYHTHPGYWCGDRYARESFRKHVESKFSSIEDLNKAWGTSFAEFAQVEPFVPFVPDKGWSARARLDMIQWYRDSMTNWSSYWLSTVRKYFPCTDLYLCTGGDGQPMHGSDFSAQCKAAAKYEAGVRITNEASDYAFNFSLTRLIASASKNYGSYCAFEPAGDVTPNGITSRIYNVVTSNARGLHTYYPTILTQAGGIASWSKSYKWLGTQAAKYPQIAVLFPQTAFTLKGGGINEKIKPFRDAVDFDLVDESMVRDGALKHYKVLVILDGKVMEREDIDRIIEWIRGGGIAVTCNYGGFSTVEGDESLFHEMFDTTSTKPHSVKSIGSGLTVYISNSWEDGQKAAIEEIARALDNLSTRVRTNLVPDGQVDGVYITDINGGWLIYNTNDHDVEKELQTSVGHYRNVKLPAGSIKEYPER
ncbi:MAG: family 14 glycosylhydrolase [Armatimonadota bacterium]